MNVQLHFSLILKTSNNEIQLGEVSPSRLLTYPWCALNYRERLGGCDWLCVVLVLCVLRAY